MAPDALPLLALALMAGAGHAQSYGDATGRSWTAAPLKEGMEMRSAGDRFLLLPSCAARSTRHGTGRWSWANGGFRVQFPAALFLFPRQSPPLEDPTGRCRL